MPQAVARNLWYEPCVKCAGQWLKVAAGFEWGAVFISSSVAGSISDNIRHLGTNEGAFTC